MDKITKPKTIAQQKKYDYNQTYYKSKSKDVIKHVALVYQKKTFDKFISKLLIRPDIDDVINEIIKSHGLDKINNLIDIYKEKE